MLPALLQSPLFVADALLDAAAQQLAAELAVAQQDAASVRLVHSQLASFRREMEKEGQLQRDEVARQVAGSARKAAGIVDQLLQVLLAGCRLPGSLPCGRLACWLVAAAAVGWLVVPGRTFKNCAQHEPYVLCY
jgi:hypothetical protein